MVFIPKDKFIYASNSSLNLRRDPNNDRVSFSQTIGFGFRNWYRIWHPFSSNSSMMVGHHMKFQVVDSYHLTTIVTIDWNILVKYTLNYCKYWLLSNSFPNAVFSINNPKFRYRVIHHLHIHSSTWVVQHIFNYLRITITQ